MTKYETVAQAIKTDIENGVYTEGQAIPTEELLTAQYDVSRQTIRKALALLVEDDLIIKRQGSGSVVRPKRLNPRTGKIAVVATYISDYIFPSQLRAVDEVLSENKYTAVLSATRNRVCNERVILEEILKNPVDGILIEGTKSAMPNPNFDLYEKLIGMGIPVDHLYASAVFLPYIQSLKLEELVIATPDVGGSKRASTFSKYLGVPLVLCNKSREKANEVASMQIIGDVKNKNVVLIDDIVDTAGTITKAANIMLEAGAKSVRAIASHCVMSDPASFRVQESGLTEMVFTDSIPYAKKCAKVKQLSIADMFAETIKRVMNNKSISSQYII